MSGGVEPSERRIVGVTTTAALIPLNSTMIAVGLPELAHELHVHRGTAAILVTTYLVAMAVNRDQFAAYNGTAPVEVSSGGRVTHRLSRRGNRRLNHAIHMAAVTQIRHAHSDGRACFDRKVAEGKTKKEALRALKRQVSNAVYRQLLLDAER